MVGGYERKAMQASSIDSRCVAPEPPLSGKECRGDGLAGRVSGDLVAANCFRNLGYSSLGPVWLAGPFPGWAWITVS
ncbi:MAG: hypothetical protein Ct9H300mP12_16980 [Acidimicrobiales bacterium]|nr:MAG: hypothetical protein Ct9H300mP12_16980 [Acidimicrobiales bacterium]